MFIQEKVMRNIAIILTISVLTGYSCATPNAGLPANPSKTAAAVASRDSTQTIFWQTLQKLCGKAYRGVIVAGPENDTVFAGKALVMHVRACENDRISIPFFVGTDSSRTWVLTRDDAGILLKHDHRHADGTPDKITMYGGKTANFGASIRQFFPADQETANLIPAAIGNVWWIDLVPGKYFTYNLRRVNTDRLFTVRFDLEKPIAAPGKPWGWKD